MRKGTTGQFSLFPVEDELKKETSSVGTPTAPSVRQETSEAALYAPIWSSSKPKSPGPVRIERLRELEIPIPYLPSMGERFTPEQDIAICVFQIRRDMAVVRNEDWGPEGKEFYQHRADRMRKFVQELQKETQCQNLSPP